MLTAAASEKTRRDHLHLRGEIFKRWLQFPSTELMESLDGLAKEVLQAFGEDGLDILKSPVRASSE